MKKKKETIINGIIALLFSQILIKIIGLLYKLYLTNKEGFGDTGNAIYSSGFQIYALLLTFSSTGVPNAIAKLVAERLAVGDSKGAHRIFKIAFFVFAFFGMTGTILLFLGAKIIAKDWLQILEAEYSLIALAPSIFFVSITAVIRGYFSGRQKLSVTAKSQTVEQIFKTLFTILLVEIIAKISNNNTMLMAGIANLATTVATFCSFSYIYMYYIGRRKEIATEINQSVNYKPVRIRKTLKIILKESIPVSLTSLMSAFNKNIDLFTVVRILKKVIGEEQAKIQYGILSGKVDMLCVLPLSLNIPFVTAMVPSIAKSNAKGEDLNEKINYFIKTTILISLPSVCGMIIFAKPILELLFPNANSGVVLLQINSISIFFAMLAQTINAILQAIGKINIPAIAFGIGMIFKVITNIILIKIVGINGAAIGNIICNLVVVFIGMIILYKECKIKIDLKKFIFKLILAIFFMSIISLYTYIYLKRIIYAKMATIVAIGVAICIYLISVISLRIIPIFGILGIKSKKNK